MEEKVHLISALLDFTIKELLQEKIDSRYMERNMNNIRLPKYFEKRKIFLNLIFVHVMFFLLRKRG